MWSFLQTLCSGRLLFVTLRMCSCSGDWECPHTSPGGSETSGKRKRLIHLPIGTLFNSRYESISFITSMHPLLVTVRQQRKRENSNESATYKHDIMYDVMNMISQGCNCRKDFPCWNTNSCHHVVIFWNKNPQNNVWLSSCTLVHQLLHFRLIWTQNLVVKESNTTFLTTQRYDITARYYEYDLIYSFALYRYTMKRLGSRGKNFSWLTTAKRQTSLFRRKCSYFEKKA